MKFLQIATIGRHGRRKSRVAEKANKTDVKAHLYSNADRQNEAQPAARKEAGP